MKRLRTTHGRVALCGVLALTIGSTTPLLAEEEKQAKPTISEVQVFKLDEGGDLIRVDVSGAVAPKWIHELSIHKPKEGEPEVAWVRTVGDVMMVGADGKAVSIDLSDEENELQLPPEIVKRMKEAQEKARLQLVEAERQMANAQVEILKANDQVKLKKEEAEKLRKQLQEASKRLKKLSDSKGVIVEGIPLDTERQAAVSNVEEALKLLNEKAKESSDDPQSYRRFFYTLAKDRLKDGQLPEEIRLQIAEAMKHRDVHWYAKADTHADPVSSKLDKILERLDKLESEVAELRKE